MRLDKPHKNCSKQHNLKCSKQHNLKVLEATRLEKR